MLFKYGYEYNIFYKERETHAYYWKLQCKENLFSSATQGRREEKSHRDLAKSAFSYCKLRTDCGFQSKPL